MYAVIESGGKQYRVELGSEIAVDHLDVQAGDTISLAPVLLVADGDQASVGRPVVDGATVSATVVRQDRGDKIVVFKYKPKARRRVKHGHRAELTVLRIADIAWDGRSAARESEKAAAQERKAAEAAEKAAAAQAQADQELARKLASAAAAAEPDTEAASAVRKTRASAQAATAPEPSADAAEPEVAVSAAAAEVEESAETAATDAPDDETHAASDETPSRRPRSSKKDE
jgi:large subunit ribosomal protein L21